MGNSNQIKIRKIPFIIARWVTDTRKETSTIFLLNRYSIKLIPMTYNYTNASLSCISQTSSERFLFAVNVD